MANQPTSTTGWATNVVNETVTIGESNVLVTNKVEPTTELKNSGVLAREPWARSYLNWLFGNLYDWIENFRTRTSEIGRVEITTDAGRTATNYNDEFGGTWTARGSDVLAGQTVYIFERTA